MQTSRLAAAVLQRTTRVIDYARVWHCGSSNEILTEMRKSCALQAGGPYSESGPDGAGVLRFRFPFAPPASSCDHDSQEALTHASAAHTGKLGQHTPATNTTPTVRVTHTCVVSSP